MTSLEYLHSRGYTHNDVKAQNLLLDSSGCDVYLVDFGLASKYKVSLSLALLVLCLTTSLLRTTWGSTTTETRTRGSPTKALWSTPRVTDTSGLTPGKSWQRTFAKFHSVRYGRNYSVKSAY